MFRLFRRISLTQTEHVYHAYHYRDRHNVAYRPQPGTILPTGWSCDWKSWEYNDLDIYQDCLQDEFEITSLIEPLAHEISSSKSVFYAGGEYYFHFPAEMMILQRFTGTFKSHDDFVQRFRTELKAGTWVDVPICETPPGLLTLEEIRAHPLLSREVLGGEELSEIVDEIIKKREH
ncbi:hypothetical protein FB45DRAFT_867896 [Roridomyces roridus]|uniref:Uncharacterized protein n=1 Tax=Roridomyces roridus TaxID=1738132 RepID=A0AAD7BRY7_9AGAR|nr:hypothetical protein FB45DRAFT_867896 [Roridomyces roridus]